MRENKELVRVFRVVELDRQPVIGRGDDDVVDQILVALRKGRASGANVFKSLTRKDFNDICILQGAG